MTARFFEEALEQIWRIPALWADHEGGHIRQTCLQGYNHQVPHQADVFSPRQMSLRRFLDSGLGQLPSHPLKFFRLLLDRTDGVKILVELLPVTVAKLTPQRTSVLQHQIGDIAVGLDLLGSKQASVGFSRITEGGRNVPRPIP